MKTKALYSLFACVLLIACVSEFNARIPISGVEILVVDGNIVANSTQEFYFSKSFSLEEDKPPVGYDDVWVELALIGSDGYRSPLATSLGKGVYKLEIGALSTDVEYGIEFKYDGEVYQSELQKPLYTPPIDSVSWVQAGKHGDISIRVSTHDVDDGAFRYYLWNYKEDWEVQADYEASIIYDIETKTFYRDLSYPNLYCWSMKIGGETLVGTTEALVGNQVINKVLYDREVTDRRFSVLYCATITQQAITKAAYEYYLDKAKGNEGMGGLFTPQPSKIEGNIACLTDDDKRVIGYTSVCANVAESRTFIPIHDLSRPTITSSCSVIGKDSVMTFMKEHDLVEYSQYYAMGYRPIFNGLMMNDQCIPEEWSSVHCADCRYIGGKKDRPTFWPNDHY